ncbi:sperm acrosome membrane-associated protein 4 [Cheilinus undulatus]|uniref:sperm acrosome membrane-associated protein 4 n=1 Tax=Cheilinus undulatus TaxID=241271 RepID=UPI001BD1FA91|nr:sperm acrosome membrane-associated protein 4 [Cheilinus undulatus]
MNRIILQIFAVGFCFAVGHALQCYKCSLGFWNVCITSKTTCESGEQCFSGIGTAAGFVNISMKGCLKLAECNTTKDVTFPGSDPNSTSVYSMTKTCCNTELCNTAPGLPGSSGLSLTLATVTALFVANVLV